MTLRFLADTKIIDGQIAAIAHRHNLILVTRNVTDFAQFSDLQVENWYDDRT